MVVVKVDSVCQYTGHVVFKLYDTTRSMTICKVRNYDKAFEVADKLNKAQLERIYHAE